MASSGKVTGAHMWAFFFGIMFFVFLGLWYMQLRERAELVAAKKSAEASASNSESALRTRIEEIEALIAKAGYDFDVDQIGVGEPNNRTKVLGAMQEDITKYGGDVAQNTYAATIVSLRNQLDNRIQQLEQVQNDLDKQRKDYLALQDQNNTRVATFESTTDDARADLQSYIQTYDEKLSSKDDEIAQLRSNLAEALLETETTKEALSIQLKEKQDDINKLAFVNTKLKERIDEIEQISFERADGSVVNVDNSQKLVWLDIGSRDNLTPQVTFSVYDKNNQGVGRTAEDIKAQIEVTRVWEDRAEARILKADIYRPISPGDVIYTPLWESGRTFYFSFVGNIDLDGDGINDRELLHDIVESNGAEIDNEVGPDGEWIVNRGMSSNTKFLVVGEIPDPNSTEREDEKDQFLEIGNKLTELTEEARELSVRKISLNDFLAYIGYKPQRRLYVPGLSDKDYSLKAGSQSTGVNENVGDRRSTGRVSDVFSGQNSKQKTSSGRTSGAY